METAWPGLLKIARYFAGHVFCQGFKTVERKRRACWALSVSVRTERDPRQNVVAWLVGNIGFGGPTKWAAGCSGYLAVSGLKNDIPISSRRVERLPS